MSPRHLLQNLPPHTLRLHGPRQDPSDLAQATVNVSLARACRISGFLAQLSANFQGTKMQRSAIGDCVDLMLSSVDELSKTLSEL
ncbi:21 kDa protein [Pyrus ussuriensis x Pyrus communis]|uniref:21 kDa protein n=1 Tax=Pyrus ussuriensis x Pyrus communis TaxID=2448454 RepID=A0A5N5GBZ8_9ROSA|nr:21 kDa protein [Pyrus ussuriensis x Pyrus communis]